jgi:hypothetical protein
MMIMMIGVCKLFFNKLCSFRPGTVNIFRKMVGLPETAWNKEYENKKGEDGKSYLHSRSIQHESNQSTLSDFTT